MKLRNSLPRRDFYPSGKYYGWTFVCRLCNRVERGTQAHCPSHGPMMCFGGKARIPRKADVKGWKEFWKRQDLLDMLSTEMKRVNAMRKHKLFFKKEFFRMHNKDLEATLIALRELK